MRKVAVAFFIVTVLSVLVVFQNCTQPTIPSDSTLATEADKLDFSYDAKLNQIAYMSCADMSGSSYDKSAYFSYRAGAYDNAAALNLGADNGGLRLTDTYLNYVRNRLPDAQWGLISESPANSATVMQLAIRHLGDLQHVDTASGSPAPNADYMNMLQELGPTGVSKALVELGPNQRLRYLTDGSEQGTRMEASLYFMDSETLAASIRNHLNGSGGYALGLTYTDMSSTSTNEIAARSPATLPINAPTTPNATPAYNLNRDVYGRGYQLSFSKVKGTTTNYPMNLLAGVSEQDFHNRSDHNGSWVCPTDLQFKIIRPEDAAANNCATLPDPSHPPLYLTLARNSLKYEDWFIDMTNKCIVSKKNGTGCYGPNTYVQYDLTQDCQPNPATNNALVPANMACMAFASICYRTN